MSVTVGIPLYNAADYLDGALAALTAQTARDVRFLVSDNASTDQTPDILRKWTAADQRFVIHRQDTNIGAPANFAWVLRQSRSRWFMFAAHDDLWSPNYVASLVRAAEAMPGCQLAVPRVVKTDPEGRPQTDDAVPPLLDGRTEPYAPRQLLRTARSGWFYGLFDRDALLAAQEPTRRFGHTWGNEFITMLPILLTGRVTGSNEAVYYQRQTGLSEDRYKPKTLADQKTLYRDFLREARRLLAETDLPALQRLALEPAILRYTDGHAWKLRRLVRSALLSRA